MKKFLNLFKNRIVLFFGVVLFISLIPYFIAYFMAPNANRYSVRFNYSNNVDTSLIINRENLESVKSYYIEERENEIKTKGSSKKVDYSSLNIDKLFENISIDEENSNYVISASQSLFTSKNGAKKYFTRLIENESIINNAKVTYLDNEIIVANNNIDVIQVYVIGLICSLIITLVLFIILSIIYPKFFNQDIIYDNQKLYRTPFHLSYWKNQLPWLKNLKQMTTVTILFALMICMKLIPIPSGFSNLGIGFTYLVFSVISMIYGPLTGLFIGLFSDLIGYAISPSPFGFYFPYTLNSMLAGFTYGLCFYKTNISYTKCLISRLFVNLFINVLLGSIWWANLNNLSFEGFKTYILITSLPKNLFYLLPQSILQFIVLKALVKPIQAVNLISFEQKESIRII